MATATSKKDSPNLKGLTFFFAPNVKPDLQKKFRCWFRKCGSRFEDFLDKDVDILLLEPSAKPTRPGLQQTKKKAHLSPMAGGSSNNCIVPSPHSSKQKSFSSNQSDNSQTGLSETSSSVKSPFSPFPPFSPLSPISPLTPPTPSSSGSNSVESSVTTRAKAFLRKQHQKNLMHKGQESDSSSSKANNELVQVLATARKLGIRIETTQTVLGWLPPSFLKPKSSSSATPARAKSSKAAAAGGGTQTTKPSHKVHKFQTPCIKLDDGKRKPVFLESMYLPCFNLSYNGAAVGRDKKACFYKTGFIISSVVSPSTAKPVSPSKRKHGEEEKTKEKTGGGKQHKKQEQVKFCERCEKSYLSESKHLKSETHVKYDEEESNFTELLDYLQENQIDFQSFLDKNNFSNYKTPSSIDEQQLEDEHNSTIADEELDRTLTTTTYHATVTNHPINNNNTEEGQQQYSTCSFHQAANNNHNEKMYDFTEDDSSFDSVLGLVF